MDTDAFLQGQTDCANGVPHTDKGEDYNRGYSAQYQHEQNVTNAGLKYER